MWIPPCNQINMICTPELMWIAPQNQIIVNNQASPRKPIEVVLTWFPRQTDQAVDSNNINTQSFRAAAESLSTYTGHGLIEWTTEKYGPPVSYTAASLANQLDLIFDAGGTSRFYRLFSWLKLILINLELKYRIGFEICWISANLFVMSTNLR